MELGFLYSQRHPLGSALARASFILPSKPHFCLTDWTSPALTCTLAHWFSTAGNLGPWGTSGDVLVCYNRVGGAGLLWCLVRRSQAGSRPRGTGYKKEPRGPDAHSTSAEPRRLLFRGNRTAGVRGFSVLDNGVIIWDPALMHFSTRREMALRLGSFLQDSQWAPQNND